MSGKHSYLPLDLSAWKWFLFGTSNLGPLGWELPFSLPWLLILGQYFTIWPPLPQPQQLLVPTRHSPICFLLHIQQVGHSFGGSTFLPFWGLVLETLLLRLLERLEGTLFEKLFFNLPLLASLFLYLRWIFSTCWAWAINLEISILS